MSREPNIPLFLWIATAVLVHLVSGKGADSAAEVLEERADIRQFANAVRRYAHMRGAPIQVSLLADEQNDDSLDLPSEHGEAEPGTPEETPEETDEPIESDDQNTEQDEPEQPEVDDTKAPEPPKKEEKEPEPEPEKEKPKEDSDTQFPKLNLDKRIAVVQHVEDEDQQDNPNAEFIGDQANRVEEQTQARITATDQNDPDPNPGSSFQSPAATPGNAHVTDIAHSEDSPGEMDRAPNETSSGAEAEAQAQYREPRGGGSPQAKLQADSKMGASDGKSSTGKAEAASNEPSPGQPAALASEGADAVSETVASEAGRFDVQRAREATPARRARRARKRQLPTRRGNPDSPMEFLGLGANGTTRGGINLNLSPHAAIAAVGRDQLDRERQADGERRRSKHRGSWKTVGLERWRAAIENYVSSVKPGNQTALNTARVPFASYLNQIHNRLHPIFADSFLASLDDLPKSHPLSRPELKTNLEIVLDRDQGKIVKMGVTRSSGSTVFDIAALESVQSASPFGKAPPSIVSPDGNVYLHWEFHRNPFYACSTYFARPFKLKVDPKSAPSDVEPSGPPLDPREQHGRGQGGRSDETYASR